MNHLHTFEGFGAAKSQTASLSKSREEMKSQRRELMNKMVDIRQQITTARTSDTTLIDNALAPVVPSSMNIEVGEPMMADVGTLERQYESLKQELRQLNRLLG